MRELEEDIEIPKFIPNVLRPSDLKGIPIDEELVGKIPGLMTPDEVLHNYEFPTPGIITPDNYPDFNSLLGERGAIRHLRLLPIKSPEEYGWYHSQPKDQLLARVKDYLGPETLALAPNVFPYLLPRDLRQYLLWIGNNEVEKQDVVNFCAQAMTVFNLTTNDLIMFERSLKTKTKIVKGTFSQVRHIHFWMRDR